MDSITCGESQAAGRMNSKTSLRLPGFLFLGEKLNSCQKKGEEKMRTTKTRGFKILAGLISFALLFNGNVYTFANEIESGTHISCSSLNQSSNRVQSIAPVSDVTAQVAGNTGAMSTSYRIDIAELPNCPVPDLKLDYSSANKINGLVGYGWDFAIGRIERSGIRGGVPKYNLDDVFYLKINGNSHELVKFAEKEDCIIYKTRHETFYKIKADFNNNCWQVTNTKGTKYLFSLHNGPIGNPVSWVLTEIVDIYNNKAEIYYQSESERYNGNDKLSMLMPKTIQYNIKDGIRSIYRINFIYESREDNPVLYGKGIPIRIDQRLAQIKISKKDFTSGDELPLWKYQLEYEYSPESGRSLLKEIYKESGDGEHRFPSTVFEYQDNSHLEGVGSAWDKIEGYYEVPNLVGDYIDRDKPINQGRGVQIVDVNDDGFADILESILINDGRHEGWPRVETKRTWINRGNGEWQQEYDYISPLYFDFGDIDETGEVIEGDDIRFDNKTVTLLYDVNGDMKVDVMHQDYYGDGIFINEHGSAQVYYNNGSSGWDPSEDNFSLPKQVSSINRGSRIWYRGVRFIDLNNDGFSDFIQSLGCNLHQSPESPFPGIPGSRGGHDMEFYRYAALNKGDGNFESLDNSSFQAPPLDSSVLFDFLSTYGQWGMRNWDLGVRLFDANGDGLPDIVRHSRMRYTNETYDEDGMDILYGRLYVNEITYNTGYGWKTPEQIIGCPEFTQLLCPESGDDHVVNYGDIICDINGDDLNDIVRGVNFYEQDEPHHRRVYINKRGKYFSNNTRFKPPLYFTVAQWTTDLNDGEVVDVDDFKNYSLGKFISDANCDGMLDIIDIRNKETYINKGKIPDLLVSITNPLGCQTEINYKYNHTVRRPVVDSLVTYSYTDSPGYRKEYIYGTINEEGNEVPAWYLTPDRRDFLGFHKVTEIDIDTGHTKITYFEHEESLAGRPRKVLIGHYFDSVESEYEKKTEYKYRGQDSDELPYYRPLEKVDVFSDYYHPINSRIEYEYDENGNCIREVYYGDVDYEGDEKTILRKYVPNEEKNILSLPCWKIICESTEEWTDSVPCEAALEKYFCYDGQGRESVPIKGFLSKEEVTGSYIGQDRQRVEMPVPVTKYNYDGNDVYQENSYGNVTSTTDSRENRITKEYDSDFHAYVVSETNAKGHTTSYKYYGIDGSADMDRPRAFYGKLRHIIDPNRVWIKRCTYDELGRLKTITKPYDENAPYKTITYEYNIAGSGYHNVKQYQTTQGSSVLETTTYLDGFGRPVKVVTGSEDPNKLICVDTEYNSKGKVKKQSFPYFVSPPSYGQMTQLETRQWTEYEYDCLDRIQVIQSPTGTLSKNYEGWRTTVYNEEQIPTEYEHDAYGRIISVVEHNEGQRYVTFYYYDVLGNLIEIRDNEDDIITMVYDSFGNMVDLIHPDRGNEHYEYDLNGNLVSQTDAKGQEMKCWYDELNRLEYKEYYENDDFGWAAFTYDGCGQHYHNQTVDDENLINPIGRMTEMVRGGSASTRWYYDKRGRCVREEKSVPLDDGNPNWYVTETTYDSADRVTSVKHPDGTVIDYTYNLQGQIESIGNYVRDINYNARNKMTSIFFRNGLTTTYDYFSNYRLKAIKTFRTFDMPDGINPRVPVDSQDPVEVGLSLDPGMEGIDTPIQIPLPDEFKGREKGRTKKLEGLRKKEVESRKERNTEELKVTTDKQHYNLGEMIQISIVAPKGFTHIIWWGLNTGDCFLDKKHIVIGDSTDLAFNIDKSGTYTIKVNATNSKTGETEEGLVTFTVGNTGRKGNIPSKPREKQPTKKQHSARKKSGHKSKSVNQEVIIENQGLTMLQHLEFDYYAVGDIESIQDMVDPRYSQRFEYDDLSRLVRADSDSYSDPLINIRGSISYDYNSMGNILQKDSKIYEYNNQDKPHQMDVVLDNRGLRYDYTYDENGNIKSVKARPSNPLVGTGFDLNITYDINNMPTDIDKDGHITRFFYDGDNKRVKKIDPDGVTTIYKGDIYEQRIEGDEVTDILYISVNNRRIAQIEKKNGRSMVKFYHPDHLGSGNLITDEDSSVVEYNHFMPYGEMLEGSVGAETNNLFNGKELDESTGLYNYDARQYNPVIGRFISPDDRIAAYDPQQINPYAYCRNNPVKYIDPSGHEPELHFFGNEVPIQIVEAIALFQRAGLELPNMPIAIGVDPTMNDYGETYLSPELGAAVFIRDPNSSSLVTVLAHEIFGHVESGAKVVRGKDRKGSDWNSINPMRKAEATNLHNLIYTFEIGTKGYSRVSDEQYAFGRELQTMQSLYNKGLISKGTLIDTKKSYCRFYKDSEVCKDMEPSIFENIMHFVGSVFNSPDMNEAP